MAFQRFIGRRARASTPKISILANGLIEFNEASVRKFALNRFTSVLLFFDREDNRVGIQFTNNPRDQGAIRIIKKPNGIVIPAREFLTANGLMKERSIAYDFQYSGEQDMYIIDVASRNKKTAHRKG